MSHAISFLEIADVKMTPAGEEVDGYGWGTCLKLGAELGLENADNYCK